MVSIQEQRIKKGLTQKELAQKMCVAQSTISNIEKGISKPNIQECLKFAQILDINLKEIFENYGYTEEDYYLERENPRITLGKYLASARKQMGYTQSEAAKLIRFSQGMMAHIESGQAIPSLISYGRIIEAYHLNAVEALSSYASVKSAFNLYPQSDIDDELKQNEKEKEVNQITKMYMNLDKESQEIIKQLMTKLK